MVETITPVVYGGDLRRYYTAVALHVAGATLSAAAFGLLLGVVGFALGAPWGQAGLAAVAIVALIYAARELLGVPVPLPDLDRQVPEWWRTFFGPYVAAFLYGLGLGIGYLTFLSFGTLVAVTAGAVSGGDPWVGAALMAPFGTARALGVLAGRGDVARVLDLLETDRARRRAAYLNGGVLVSLALLAAGALV